jgi:hypothetical protein
LTQKCPGSIPTYCSPPIRKGSDQSEWHMSNFNKCWLKVLWMEKDPRKDSHPGSGQKEERQNKHHISFIILKTRNKHCTVCGNWKVMGGGRKYNYYCNLQYFLTSVLINFKTYY